VTYAKYRDYQTKRQRAEAERKRRQREAERARQEAAEAAREAEGGTCPGTSRGRTHETSNVKRQTSDTTNDNGRAPATDSGNGSRKGAGAATARELQALEADPALVDIGDAWVRAFKRPRRELGVLRAARTALAGGYAPDAMKLVVRVTALAREAPERFPDRGSIRWAVEHGKAGDPGYLLRPATLDRLIPEAEAWDRA
jgi:hypothetical protein